MRDEMINSTVNCQPDTLEAMLDAIEASLKEIADNLAEARETEQRTGEAISKQRAQWTHAAQIEQQMHTARMENKS